jgi:hypothetical protein
MGQTGPLRRSEKISICLRHILSDGWVCGDGESDLLQIYPTCLAPSGTLLGCWSITKAVRYIHGIVELISEEIATNRQWNSAASFQWDVVNCR